MRIGALHQASAAANFPETWRFLVARRGTLGMFMLGLALLSMLSYATMNWYPTMSTNILGLVLGPTAVASITQYGFHDPNALRYSLAIVSFCSGSVACWVLYRSLENFRRTEKITDGMPRPVAEA